MANAAGTAIAVSLIGERLGGGIGSYERIFVLTIIGGLVASVLGSFMGERRPRRVTAAAPAVG
jgi:hypothetical protein